MPRKLSREIEYVIMTTMEQKPTSLVTGGAGFIGSHVVDELLERGHRVVVLDDLSGGFIDNVNKKALFVAGSVTDKRLVNELFEKHSFDYVFHLAAYAAEGLSHFIRSFNYENNLQGSINLINASVNNAVKTFVFTSSVAVYGRNQVPMTEDLVPTPEDPYGISKYAVELDLKAAHEIFGLDYIVFRPHNVYGERQNIGDKYRNVAGIFMNKVMEGEPLPIFGDGKQVRAFSHIANVAPVITNSIDIPEARNQIFNVGADTPYTVLELAEVISKAMGVPLNIIHLPERNEVKIAYADHSKTTRVFGSISSIVLEEGIKRMAEWAKSTGARTSKKFGAIEISKNLPESWI